MLPKWRRKLFGPRGMSCSRTTIQTGRLVIKAADSDLWERQVEDLLAHEIGEEFLKFFEWWVDSSEDVLLNYPEKTPLEALRLTLPQAEIRFGEITAPMLGNMLTLVVAHWKRGDEVAAELSSLELKLVTEVLALKLEEWQDSAQAGDS